MSEVLTLAETFKNKSNEQAETIEKELNNVMQTLNASITKSLRESESIIKHGTESLNESGEQLQQVLEKTNKSIISLVQTHSEQSQALTRQALTESAEQYQALIQSHTKAVRSMIEQNQSELYQVIKSDIRKYLIGSGIVALVILMIGLMLGGLIVQRFTTPKTYTPNPLNQPIQYGSSTQR